MTNAVICYTGNVCSTPMVEYARLSDKIFVPTREQFDVHKLRQSGIGEDKICSDLAEILSHLFQRRRHPFLVTGRVGRYHGLRQLPKPDDTPHILFKWRPYPLDLSQTRKLREVFARFEVVPALMLRRSLVAQCLKLHLSEKVYGGRHPQFEAGRMSSEEYEVYRKDQREISVSLDMKDVHAVRALATGFFRRTANTVRRVKYYFPHVEENAVIVAEDIFRPSIDLEEHTAALSNILKDEIAIDDVEKVAVRKAGLEVGNCANAEIVLQDNYLTKLEEAYSVLVDGTALSQYSDAELEAHVRSVRDLRTSVGARLGRMFTRFRARRGSST